MMNIKIKIILFLLLIPFSAVSMEKELKILFIFDRDLTYIPFDAPLTREVCVNKLWKKIESFDQVGKNEHYTLILKYLEGLDVRSLYMRGVFSAAALIGVDTNEYHYEKNEGQVLAVKHESQEAIVVNRALAWAVEYHDRALVKLLLDSGASPFAYPSAKYDRIIFRVEDVDIANHFYDKDPLIVDVRKQASCATLLSCECDKDAPPRDLAWHTTRGRGSLDLVAWLIAHGSDVNAGDKEGYAPLHQVCYKLLYHAREYAHAIALFKMLMNAGADYNKLNMQKKKPCDLLVTTELRHYNFKFSTLVTNFITTLRPKIHVFNCLMRDRTSLVSTLPGDIKGLIQGLLVLELDKEYDEHKDLPDEQEEDDGRGLFD